MRPCSSAKYLVKQLTSSDEITNKLKNVVYMTAI